MFNTVRDVLKRHGFAPLIIETSNPDTRQRLDERIEQSANVSAERRERALEAQRQRAGRGYYVPIG
ncbi:MAG: hypothetical protein ACTHJR_10965 [Sphingomonas sp.]|uniref:hypothetical protein n=1 Tax=Sphingomonas sp. TaxID=28214 RepID=UPI003F8002A7